MSLLAARRSSGWELFRRRASICKREVISEPKLMGGSQSQLCNTRASRVTTPAPNPYLAEAADNASRSKAQPQELVGHQRPGREVVQPVFLFPLWFWLCKIDLSLKIPCIQNLLLPACYAPWRPWSTAAPVPRTTESLVFEELPWDCNGLLLGPLHTPLRRCNW